MSNIWVKFQMCWSATVILFLRWCGWLPRDSSCGSFTRMERWHRPLLNVNKSTNWDGVQVTQALTPIFISQWEPEQRTKALSLSAFMSNVSWSFLKFQWAMRKRNSAWWHVKLYHVDKKDETNTGARKKWWKLSSPKVFCTFAQVNKRSRHYFSALTVW